ncbi:MAG: DUF433 domain-containing protein [Anaerolineales bacterium]|nr:DUF433 domain-containing protein [Anaerolineales bacterium]
MKTVTDFADDADSSGWSLATTNYQLPTTTYQLSHRKCPMAIQLQTEIPPLYQDVSGALRVGDSRVLLEIVINAFEDGATPEAIVQRYPTVTLADAYAVIAYYLRHREDIEVYLAEREGLAKSVQRRIENQQGSATEMRNRLLARLQDKI